jgi:hypothetical protein
MFRIGRLTRWSVSRISDSWTSSASSPRRQRHPDGESSRRRGMSASQRGHPVKRRCASERRFCDPEGGIVGGCGEETEWETHPRRTAVGESRRSRRRVSWYSCSAWRWPSWPLVSR